MLKIKIHAQSMARKEVIALIALLAFVSVKAHDGPGGIARTNGKSSLALWLRADQGVKTQVNPKNGNRKVKEWKDLSGNGFALSQTNPKNMPHIKNSGVNEKPFIQFQQGDNDFLTGSGFKGLVNKRDYTIFIVSKTAPVGGQVLLSGVKSVENERGKPGLFIAKPKPSIHPNHEAASNYRFTHRCPFRLSQKSGKNVYTTRNKKPQGNTKILGFIKNRTQKQKVLINGEAVSHTALSNGSNKPFSSELNLTIGSLAKWMNAMNLHGKIGEVIIFNRALSEVEKNTVQKYLHKRYGIKQQGDDRVETTPAPVQGLDGMGRSAGKVISSIETGSMSIYDGSYLDGRESYLFAGYKPLSNVHEFTNSVDFPKTSDNAWWLDFDRQNSMEDGGIIKVAFHYTKGQKQPGKSDNYRIILKSPESSSGEVIPIKPEISHNKLIFKLDTKVIHEYFPKNKGWLVLGTKKPFNAPLPETIDPGYHKTEDNNQTLLNEHHNF